MIIEHFFSCPYCGEQISMLLDLTESQSYVEDCEVCCNAIQVNYTADEGELLGFSAMALNE